MSIRHFFGLCLFAAALTGYSVYACDPAPCVIEDTGCANSFDRLRCTTEFCRLHEENAASGFCKAWETAIGASLNKFMPGVPHTTDPYSEDLARIGIPNVTLRDITDELSKAESQKIVNQKTAAKAAPVDEKKGRRFHKLPIPNPNGKAVN